MPDNESSNKKEKIQTRYAKLSESVEYTVSSAAKEPPTPTPKKKEKSE